MAILKRGDTPISVLQNLLPYLNVMQESAIQTIRRGKKNEKKNH